MSLGDRISRLLHIPRTIAPSRAYDLWAENYDAQRNNLVLTIEGELFAAMLRRVELAGARVLDVGCGTGRHWPLLREGGAATITGVDVSRAMLDRLVEHFPGAEVHLVRDERLPFLPDGAIDLLVSSVMLGYSARFRATLREWHRVVTDGGAMLITDFHPEGLRRGMKRTFSHNGKVREITYHPYSLEDLRLELGALGCTIEAFEEYVIDERARASYERAGKPELFERWRGTPLVFAMLARKVK